VDVWVPTTDGRLLILPRYTQPEKDHQMLLHQLHLQLPSQPSPQDRFAGGGNPHLRRGNCSEDLLKPRT